MRKFKKIFVAGLTLALVFSMLMVQAFADYDEEGGNTPLICGLEETEGHAHTDTCICPGGELICGQTEEVSADGSKIHTHTEDCYCRGGELICGLQETEAHHHDASCYEVKEERDKEQSEKDDDDATMKPSENTAAMIDSEEYETLQAAIDDVKSGEIIKLCKDVTESVKSNGANYTLDMQGYTMSGIAGKSVYMISKGTVYLNNGTITGGKASYGGGIYLDSNGELHGKNLLITNNEATTGYGGGILAMGSLYLEDSTVSDNIAPDYGGGISLYSNGKLNGKNLIVENNQVNSVRYDKGFGGGIYIDITANLKIEDTTISKNKSNYGGGIYSDGICSIDDSVIKDNNCQYGGGLYVGKYGILPALNNTAITGNTADSGAALYFLSDYDLNAVGCSFNQNMSDSGSMSDILMLSGWGDKTFSSCQISENTGTKNTVSANVGKVNFIDCRITDNRATKAGAIDLSNVSREATVTISGTVIKDNQSEGKDAISGGIYIKRGKLIMESGALYDNLTSAENGANDLFVEKSEKYKAEIKILPASQMEDGDYSFTDYVWKDDLKGTSEEGNLSGTSEEARAFTAYLEREIAQIDDRKYTSLAQAVEAAKDGDVIKLIAGDDDEHGSGFTSNTISFDSKRINIDFNNCTVKSIGRLFNIGEKAKLTITGEGKFVGTISNKGSFELGGSVKSDTIIHQGKSLVINGEAEALNIELGEGQFINAGNDFSVKSLTLTLDSKTLSRFNGATAVSDLVLVKGSDDEGTASATKVKNLTNHFVSVTTADNNIVLHKSDTKGVYLDGKSGKDDNQGLSLDKPVKTFEKAKELLEASGDLSIIYVIGTVEVSSDASWSLDGTLQRYSGFTGNLIRVKGRLALNDIVVDGASRMSTSGNSSLIEIQPSGTLEILAGAVMQNNDVTKSDRSFTVGGAVDNDGKLLIDGGIIQNCKALLGGGIYSSGGSITMKSGTISNNQAVENNLMATQSAGGGIMLGYGANLIMEGGEIRDNTSKQFGGGVALGSINSAFVDEKNSFIMNGGTIAGNSSGNTGGGIFVQCNCEATINAGHITNNWSKGGQYGGGGIYVNGGRENFASNKVFVNGQLNLYNVVVRDNEASLAGGGIANCPTSNFNLYLSNGGAIYQNSARDAGDVLVANAYLSGAVHGFISEYMLGDGLYHWKDDRGEEIAVNQLHNVSAIHAHTDCKTGSQEAENAEALAKVFITDNKANQNGGGIGSNGNVTIGENPNETVDISVKKVWEDQNNSENKRPDSIKVWLYRNGERVGFVTIKPDALGIWPESVFFTNQPVKDADGNDYVYTVKEDSEGLGGFYESSVSGGGSQWTITNKLVPETPTTPVNPPDTPVIPPDVPETPDEPILPPDEFLPEDPDNPNNPDNPVTPPDEFLPITPGTKDDQPKMTGTVLNKSETPKTGDDAPLAITLLLMLLSGAGLVAVKLAYREKCKENH